jgi:hypothetical protein
MKKICIDKTHRSFCLHITGGEKIKIQATGPLNKIPFIILTKKFDKNIGELLV